MFTSEGSIIPELDDQPETLIHRADRALYQVKAEGRDRIILDTFTQRQIIQAGRL